MKIDKRSISTYSVELQIPHSFCAQVQETGNLWKDKSRHRTKNKKTM